MDFEKVYWTVAVRPLCNLRRFTVVIMTEALRERLALIRLVGAVLAEQHDGWIEGRRYLGLDVLTRSRVALTSTDQAAEQERTTTPALTA